MQEVEQNLRTTTIAKASGTLPVSVIIPVRNEAKNLPRCMQIWQFLTLELWSRVFLDGGSRQMAADTIQAQQAATA